MRYLDSGRRRRTDTLFDWLDSEVDTARTVRVQTGYFSAPVLEYFEERLLVATSNAGGSLSLVTGGHVGATTTEDIRWLVNFLERLRTPSRGVAVVLGDPAVIHHAKTYHVARRDGSSTALVGSPNLTPSGAMSNIESALVLDTRAGDDPTVLQSVADATDEWFDHGRQPFTVPLDLRAAALLTAYGVAERRTAPRRVAAHGSGRPHLGGVADLPDLPRRARRRSARPASSPVPQGATLPTMGGTGQPFADGTPRWKGAPVEFPQGAVGVLKPVPRSEVARISDTPPAPGTVALALGIPSQHLPWATEDDTGSDLRLDVVAEARLSSRPHDSASSGLSTSQPNITYEGTASGTRTHRDLRLNIHRGVADGLRRLALEHAVPLPEATDLVVVEFADTVPLLVRLTFVTRASDGGLLDDLEAASLEVSPRSRTRWVGDEALRLLPAWE